MKPVDIGLKAVMQKMGSPFSLLDSSGLSNTIDEYSAIVREAGEPPSARGPSRQAALVYSSHRRSSIENLNNRLPAQKPGDEVEEVYHAKKLPTKEFITAVR